MNKNDRTTFILAVISCLMLSLSGACRNQPSDIALTSPPQTTLHLAELTGQAYKPVKIAILPLTEIVPAQSPEQKGRITIYVSLLDAANSAIKYPGVFRFELYEYLPDLVDPKGQRLAIWQDQDLTAFSDNNAHWQDYLRAYQFDLAFQYPADRRYVLVVTYTAPDNTRISDQIKLAAE